MTKLHILGTGCAKCQALTDVVHQAAQELGLTYDLEKVTDVVRMADFGVVRTPALVVDGVVKLTGRVPTLAEAKNLLQA